MIIREDIEGNEDLGLWLCTWIVAVSYCTSNYG